MLETVGRVVNRMAELKGMATQDPMKSDQDIESYNNEFTTFSCNSIRSGSRPSTEPTFLQKKLKVSVVIM